MPKRKRRSTDEALDAMEEFWSNPSEWTRRDEQGRVFVDNAKFVAKGAEVHGKLKVVRHDPVALFMALQTEPYRSLRGVQDVLRDADSTHWYRALVSFIRLHGISELPGVTIHHT